MSVRTSAWGYLQNLVAEGLSKNAIQDTLKGVGLGYRRAVMLADIDVLQGRSISERALLSFPKYFIPDPAYTTFTPKNLKEQYLYEFKSTGRSLVTGEPEERVYSMYTDDFVTIGEAETGMYDKVADRGEMYNFEVESLELTTVWQKGKE